MKKVRALCGFLLLAGSWSFAQSNELSFSAGATVTSNQNLTSTILLFAPCPIGNPTCNVISGTSKANTAFTFQGVYARHLAGAGPISLLLELPVMGTPGHDINTIISNPLAGTTTGTTSSTLLFFTPSARIKLFSTAPISPWMTAGGGLAHLGLGNQTRNTGALQFGGGIDFKTGLPHLGLRAEVRDFWSGSVLQAGTISITGINTVVSPEHQHHLFAGGGVVLKF